MGPIPFLLFISAAPILRILCRVMSMTCNILTDQSGSLIIFSFMVSADEGGIEAIVRNGEFDCLIVGMK